MKVHDLLSIAYNTNYLIISDESGSILEDGFIIVEHPYIESKYDNSTIKGITIGFNLNLIIRI